MQRWIKHSVLTAVVATMLVGILVYRLRLRESMVKDDSFRVVDFVEVRSVLYDAPVTTVQRLHWRKSNGPFDDLNGYERDAPISLGRETSDHLRELLERRQLPMEEAVTELIPPEYILLITLRSSRRELGIAFDSSPAHLVTLFQSGVPKHSVSCVQIAPEFAALFKPLFPNDSEIQGL